MNMNMFNILGALAWAVVWVIGLFVVSTGVIPVPWLFVAGGGTWGLANFVQFLIETPNRLSSNHD